MPYKISADEIPNALAMGGEIRPRMKGDEPKLAPNGKPTYSSGVVVARPDGGQDRGVTIAVINAPSEPWQMGTVLRPTGQCWLTPYVATSGDRASLGLSFIVESLVPVNTDNK